MEKGIDPKELDFADTVFIRDIDSRVFQAITFKCLSGVDGVALAGGNLFDTLLGRESSERVKGITVEQDQKNHAVNIRIELNVAYGLSIPEKAEEVQAKVAREVAQLTGLHVACVHIVFRNLLSETTLEQLVAQQSTETEEDIDQLLQKKQPAGYSDEF